MENILNIIQEIESDEKILQFKSPSGQMLWPLIRNSLMIFFDENTESDTEKKSVQHKLYNIFYIIKQIGKSIPSKTDKYSIVFTRHDFDSRKLNKKLIDPTYSILASHYCNDSLVLYEGRCDKHPDDAPYKHFDILPCIKLINFISKLSFSRRHKDIAQRMAEYIKQKYFESSGNILSETNFNKIKNKIIFYSRISRIYYLFYSFLWKRIKPQIIFYTVGFYGIDSMSVRAAKDLGITTVEIQHGLIYSNHYAYNFSDTMCKNKKFAYNYQDWIFIFGKWFENRIKTPAKIYISGWPYHSLNVEHYIKEENSNETNKYILFLPTGESFIEFYNMAKNFVKKDQKHNILIRPHRLDYAIADKIRLKDKASGIIISYEESLYEVLLKTKCVVGDMSTANFTAAAFNIPVFSLKNELSDKYLSDENPFTQFTTLDELIKLINNPPKQINEFYAKNWKEKYDKFLRDMIFKENFRKDIITDDVLSKYLNIM